MTHYTPTAIPTHNDRTANDGRPHIRQPHGRARRRAPRPARVARRGRGVGRRLGALRAVQPADRVGRRLAAGAGHAAALRVAPRRAADGAVERPAAEAAVETARPARPGRRPPPRAAPEPRRVGGRLLLRRGALVRLELRRRGRRRRPRVRRGPGKDNHKAAARAAAPAGLARLGPFPLLPAHRRVRRRPPRRSGHRRPPPHRLRGRPQPQPQDFGGGVPPGPAAPCAAHRVGGAGAGPREQGGGAGGRGGGDQERLWEKGGGAREGGVQGDEAEGGNGDGGKRMLAGGGGVHAHGGDRTGTRPLLRLRLPLVPPARRGLRRGPRLRVVAPTLGCSPNRLDILPPFLTSFARGSGPDHCSLPSGRIGRVHSTLDGRGCAILTPSVDPPFLGAPLTPLEDGKPAP